ncbi:MAG TPA: PIN domain-containing protein [Candidatus Hydrogenedentes bacterium]|nr:PIN domain-containing protein [Candidatus Hydrogenedentota bacterium]
MSPSAALEVVPISDNILEIAAELRATTRLKLPDAIHMATAIVTNCTSFLTNDRSIISPTPCKVVLLSELI